MSLVYSTDQGRHCPQCNRPKTACTCKQSGSNPNSATPKSDGVVRIQRQINGRGGKTVTVVSGLIMDETSLKTLAKDLKQRCGSGGAIKDGVVEIQGDHRETLRAELQQRGYNVKLSGG